MMKPVPFFACLAAALACATLLVQPAAHAQKKSATSDPGSFDASGRYILGDSELKLDCKKLTGRTNIRLLQLRSEMAETARPSGAAQAMQTVTNPATKLLFGGASSYGTDRDSQLKRDRAVVEAYNRQLAAKTCATYDLDAELKKGPNDPPPSLVRKK